MTLEEFYEELKIAKSQFRWKNTAGLIRGHHTDHGEMCPICAVTFVKLGYCTYNANFVKAGEKLGLSLDNIMDIVGTADNIGWKYRKDIGEKLEEILL